MANAPPAPSLGQVAPESENPHFYNHGYLIIDLDGPAGTARHYQASNPEKVLFTETLA
jgi:hypothetical protein